MALPRTSASSGEGRGGVTGRAFVDPERFPRQQGYGLGPYRRHGPVSYLLREHTEADARGPRQALGPDRVSYRS